MATKMIITVDVPSGTVQIVKDETGRDAERNRPIPGPRRHIGELFAHQGSNCVTLNIPGGGSFTICG